MQRVSYTISVKSVNKRTYRIYVKDKPIDNISTLKLMSLASQLITHMH